MAALIFAGACIAGVPHSMAMTGQESQDSLSCPRTSGTGGYPSFRSVQVDVASVVVRTSVSGSVDADLFSLARDGTAHIGIRLGAEWIGTSGSGGEKQYYRDLNALGRITVAGSRGRFDLLAGMCSRREMEWGLVEPHQWLAKFGAEVRLNLVDSVFGLFGKVSITEELGIVGGGLFLAFDTFRQ